MLGRRSQAYVLQELTVANIDVRRSACTSLLEEVAEVAVQARGLRRLAQSDAVGWIGQYHPLGKAGKPSNIRDLNSNAVTSGQQGEVLPSRGHRLRIDIAASDEVGRQLASLIGGGALLRCPELGVEVRQALESEARTQHQRWESTVSHQRLREQRPRPAEGVVERTAAIPPAEGHDRSGKVLLHRCLHRRAPIMPSVHRATRSIDAQRRARISNVEMEDHVRILS